MGCMLATSDPASWKVVSCSFVVRSTKPPRNPRLLHRSSARAARDLWSKRFVVRRDWNFARSGEPATTFLKFQRSESPAQHERTFTFAEPAVRRNDSRYRFLAWDDSLVWLPLTYHTMYAAWQRAALRPGRRRRSNNLPLVVAREHRPLRRRPHWILPHVEPYPLDHDSSQSRWSSTGTEADPRAVRFLLECGSPIERTRLARAILLLPAGPVAPLGGVALYPAQSGESRFGLGGGAVALVQRSLSLRRQRAKRVFDAGAVAQPLDQHNLAGVPQRRGDGSEVDRHSPTHAYRPASGH
jgi:hypothetical protein